MPRDMLINIHSIIPLSRINGPGERMVVFSQGCNRKCPGCFNPDTHPFNTVKLFSPDNIFKLYLTRDIEGITISGGEPFLQPEGLHALLRMARETYGLSTVVYTGFRYNELKERPACLSCLEFIDVLIDGGYEESKKERTLLARGSTNQRFHFFSDRYNRKDFYMKGKVEVIIGRDGTVTKTGFSRIDLCTN